MNLIEALKMESTILNTKGGEYYASTYDCNLDVFTMLSRFNDSDEIINTFENALCEDENMALANLLYILDIREGKGERRLFKIMFKHLCNSRPELAKKVLPLIGELGRYDYILEGMDTLIEDDVISLINNVLKEDLLLDNPSLLAKWMPSHRTHNKNSCIAKKIMKRLGLSEKEYRKMLSIIRSKINIVEKNLTEKEYDNIIFREVPTKAMLKYKTAFDVNMTDKYHEYINDVKLGREKINTEGLFVYEIIKKILKCDDIDNELYELMWNNQKDVLKGNSSNVLVMADTSGSMTTQDFLPYSTAIGLALYTAERNTGIFKNHFMTFSSKPYFYEVKGKTIKDKVRNIPSIVENTDVDKAFELLLNTAKKKRIKEAEMPSYILIISDMEFDRGVYSQEGTNFKGWKNAFMAAGYKMPKIIFWNVAACTKGVPTCRFDSDVAMINGFSTNLLEDILDEKKLDPRNVMIQKLEKYNRILDKAC